MAFLTYVFIFLVFLRLNMFCFCLILVKLAHLWSFFFLVLSRPAFHFQSSSLPQASSLSSSWRKPSCTFGNEEGLVRREPPCCQETGTATATALSRPPIWRTAPITSTWTSKLTPPFDHSCCSSHFHYTRFLRALQSAFKAQIQRWGGGDFFILFYFAFFFVLSTLPFHIDALTRHAHDILSSKA